MRANSSVWFAVAASGVLAAGFVAQAVLVRAGDRPSASVVSPLEPESQQGLPLCVASPETRLFGSYIRVPGAVVVNAGVANKSGPCGLRGQLQLEVRDASGARVPGIFANPDAIGVHRTSTGVFETSAFAWENWCGVPGDYDLVLTLGDFAHTLHRVPSPSCESPGSQSQLRSHQAARLFNDVVSGSAP